MTRLLRLGALVAGALVLAVPASGAGGLVLHPSGFGEHSYSAWKAHEGLPDRTGSKEQALYFQKHTATTTFAAGVAVIKGVEGLPASSVWPLGFWYRADGHCGAGAPRFNLTVENAGVRQTLFFGCNSGMVPGRTMEDEHGRLWHERTTFGPAPTGTVVRLAIVFDEGDDVGTGSVHLDDIQVGDHVWTSASDNGNGETIEQASVSLTTLLGAPLESLFR